MVIRTVPRSLVVAALAGAALAPSAARADAPTGRLLVLLREPAAAGPAAHASAARAVIARAGARPSGADVPQIGLVTVRPAPGGSLGALTAALRRDPAVRSVQPEYRLDLRAAPNDPALTQPETARARRRARRKSGPTSARGCDTYGTWITGTPPSSA